MLKSGVEIFLREPLFTTIIKIDKNCSSLSFEYLTVRCGRCGATILKSKENIVSFSAVVFGESAVASAHRELLTQPTRKLCPAPIAAPIYGLNLDFDAVLMS